MTSRRLPALVLALSCGAALLGCSSSGPGTAATTGTGATTTTAATRTTPTGTGATADETESADQTQPAESGGDEQTEEATAYPLVPAEPGRRPCEPEGSTWLDAEGLGTEEADVLALGEGEVGVVLLHQNDGRACAWVPVAEELVAEGYAVRVPVMEPGHWPQPLIASAVEHLRGEGAGRVAVVGASMGGTYAIVGAAESATPPDLVVSVSGPGFYRGVDPVEAVGQLDRPVLLLAAEDDGALADAAREIAGAAPEADLEILPGSAHGIDLLEEDPAAFELVRDALAGLGG